LNEEDVELFEKAEQFVSVPLKGSFVLNVQQSALGGAAGEVSVPLKGSFVLNPTRKKRSTRGGRLVSVPLKGSFVLNSMTN